MNKIAMAQDWKDKVVFYNGQIVPKGAATVKILLEEGIKHVAILDVNEEAGKSLQDELNEKYGDNRVKFIKCDVFDEDQLMNSFHAVLEEQGYIDVVVNYAFLMNDSKETYKKMINLNFVKFMSKENGGSGGTIINFTSILTLFQSELLPIYSATKSAISMFSNCIGVSKYSSKLPVPAH
ncbi:putative alcohol dehydrogenase [Operophtera brumata]|uniref:15-hydroxyprostaglandin dehydrogenase [NAD(+)] n=1 Tax=Operophtera brumata TaxID=104452 RepID=A0A0L7L8S8_OPEBR|nr:putative alcohol dehydrogenase [Operophtera brumata]